MNGWEIVETAHAEGCGGCTAAADAAAGLARATGSVGGSHADGRGHSATVRRAR